MPVRSVELRAGVDRPARCDIVHDARVTLPEIESCIRSKAVLVLIAGAEDAAAARAVVETSEQHRVAGAEGPTFGGELRSAHALERPHVHHAGEREIAEERARRTAHDVDVANAAGK